MNRDADTQGRNFDNVSQLLNSNRKRQRENTPPLIMSEEILANIDDEIGIEETLGNSINERLAKQIIHSYLESSSESTALNKIMKMYSTPENLSPTTVPKLNREIELTKGFTNNDRYVNSKEKSLYATQNYVAKAITITSKMADEILGDTDCDGSTLNHKDILQKCIHVVTLLGHVQAELTQKRKNNIRNIVNSEYQALCGPKPGSKAAAKRPKNTNSKFLLGDNLKSDAKMARAANDMFRGSRENKRPRIEKRHHGNMANRLFCTMATNLSGDHSSHRSKGRRNRIQTTDQETTKTTDIVT